MLGLGFRRSQYTDTKKLEVPSERPKTPGNSLSHVSSPYMMIFPPRCLICASQLSWLARVEDVSDSAKLRITSKKLGIEPVVRAFTRGMVIVGEVACAVNGIAEPEDMRLHNVINALVNGSRSLYLWVKWNAEFPENTKSLLKYQLLTPADSR